MRGWAALLAALWIGAPAPEAAAKPQFSGQLDAACANAGRLPPDPAAVARAAQPPFGDCALCHRFDTAQGQFPGGRNVTPDGRAYKAGSLDPFCAAPAVNAPPSLAPIGNRMVVVGTLLSLSLVGVDVDGDALLFAADPLPAGASLVDGGNGMAVFEWVPRADQVGNQTVTFSVTDGMDTASESIVIAVLPVDPPAAANRAPTLPPIADAAVEVGERLELPIGATDPDGDRLSFGVSGLPGDATFTDFGDGTASILWLPALPGAHRVTVTVMDGGVPPRSAEATFVLEALEAPARPGPRVERASSRKGGRQLKVRGHGAAPGELVTIVDDESGGVLGARRADEHGEFKASLKTFLAPCAVRAWAGGVGGEAASVRNAPADCGERLFTRVPEARWKCEGGELRVRGDRAPAFSVVRVHDADRGDLVAEVRADRRGRFRVRESLAASPRAIEVVLSSGDAEWRLGPIRVHREGACRDGDREDHDRPGRREKRHRDDEEHELQIEAPESPDS